jgi:LysR family hydrogen peroxide-inducible transcriptional activator
MNRRYLWNYNNSDTSARSPIRAVSVGRRKTNVSQPSLSQQIRKLEDELGARLFNRLGRTVQLTELGQAFLPRARAVLYDLEAARSEIVERKASISGPISIGVIPTIAPYFLPPVLATFTRKYPQVRLTVAEEITPLLLEKLRAGTSDVAIIALPLQAPGQHKFQSFPLLVEKLYVVLPKQHALAKRRVVSLEELQGDPFLLLRDGHCFRETAVAACKRARLNPKIIFESGQFSSILNMVSAGLGVSIVPAMALEKRPGCRYVPLADERAARTIGVVTLYGRSPTRANEAFLAHLGATS